MLRGRIGRGDYFKKEPKVVAPQERVLSEACYDGSGLWI